MIAVANKSLASVPVAAGSVGSVGYSARGSVGNVNFAPFRHLLPSESTADAIIEVAPLLAQMESTEDELYQLKKKFISNLKGVISPIKILKLKKAEENFNRKLLQQYRDRKLDK